MQETMIRWGNAVAFLVFTINGSFTVGIQVGCIEDVAAFLDLYKQERWQLLFSGQDVDAFDISSVQLDGLEIGADDGQGNLLRSGVNGQLSPYASVTINISAFEARQAEKLAAIRAVLERC